MKYTNIIDKFDGEYRWLSNFYVYDTVRSLSVEHHYQAAKTTNLADYLLIMSAETPNKAKQYGKPVERGGRLYEIRRDWDDIKLTLMEQFTREKYATNAALRDKLIDTSGSLLIEGNWWGDRFWGVCEGTGENHLGKIIMKIRDDFINA